MLKRSIVIILCLATAPSAAPAASHDALIQALAAEGYTRIEISRTWLGRTRISATGPGRTREIVLNRRTGEILRDFEDVAASPPLAVMPDPPDDAGERPPALAADTALGKKVVSTALREAAVAARPPEEGGEGGAAAVTVTTTSTAAVAASGPSAISEPGPGPEPETEPEPEPTAETRPAGETVEPAAKSGVTAGSISVRDALGN